MLINIRLSTSSIVASMAWIPGKNEANVNNVKKIWLGPSFQSPFLFIINAIYK